MKSTQLYRKHNAVTTLHYGTITSISHAKKNVLIKLVYRGKEWGRKHICKEFSTTEWDVSSVEDQCMIEKMNLTERKTGSG